MKAQGLTFTSQTSMWSRWAPINERTVLVGISQMACFLESRDSALTKNAKVDMCHIIWPILCRNIFESHLGILLCNALSGLIADQLGWQWLFYIYGIAGVLWAVIWLAYFKNSPEEMTSINEIELDYIIENRSKSVG